MKKVIPILFIFFVIYALTNTKELLIPDYAIRFRIIANSDSEEDQQLKLAVKQSLETELNEIMLKAKTSKEAMALLEEAMPEIEKVVNNYGVIHSISLGENYFPEKTYQGVTFPSGNYESLVITLGSGKGQNWWCVMFPPLCLLESKQNNTNNVEYKLFVQELLTKYTS